MSTLFLRNNLRGTLFVVGVAGAMFAPWWVPLLIMVILSLRYAAWEVLFIGLLVDFLWFTPSSVEGVVGLLLSLPLFTIAALLLVWGLEPLRREFLVT